MEKMYRRKTELEAELENARKHLIKLARDDYEMHEFREELELAVQDVEDILEHAFYYMMLVSKISGEPIRYVNSNGSYQKLASHDVL